MLEEPITALASKAATPAGKETVCFCTRHLHDQYTASNEQGAESQAKCPNHLLCLGGYYCHAPLPGLSGHEWRPVNLAAEFACVGPDSTECGFWSGGVSQHHCGHACAS